MADMTDADLDGGDTFSALEQTVLRHAIEDWAAQYHQTIGEPARYITEGHLAGLVAQHGTHLVWDAVADYIRTHPRVLELPVYGAEGRDARRTARAERAAQIMSAARAAYEAGDIDKALALIDEAELAEPTYRVPPGMTFDYLRRAISDEAGER